MDALPIEVLIPIAFPLIFAAFWLAVTWLIGWMSGWHALARRYPDRPEKATMQFTWRSGRMGPLGARINNILKLGVCPSGLRVALPWLFAFANKPFLVPWGDIQLTRIDGVFINEARLTFGSPQTGTLTIRDGLADEIAAAAPKGRWRG